MSCEAQFRGRGFMLCLAQGFFSHQQLSKARATNKMELFKLFSQLNIKHHKTCHLKSAQGICSGNLHIFWQWTLVMVLFSKSELQIFVLRL